MFPDFVQECVVLPGGSEKLLLSLKSLDLRESEHRSDVEEGRMAQAAFSLESLESLILRGSSAP